MKYESAFIIYFVFYYFLSVSSTNNAHKYTVKETADHDERLDYKNLGRVNNNSFVSHEFVVAIKQKNIDILEKKLYEVSDISSASYGRYLSAHEIGDIISNYEATNAVKNWLLKNDIDIVKISKYGEYIVAKSTVHKLEYLFQTEFYEYQPIHYSSPAVDIKAGHKNKNNFKFMFQHHPFQKSVIRATSYSIPSHLIDHIHSVFKLISLPPPSGYRLKKSDMLIKHKKKFFRQNHSQRYPDSAKNLHQRHHVHDLSTPEVHYTTPLNLKSFYHIQSQDTELGNQTIYASIGSTFLPSDISAFQSKYDLFQHPVDNYVGDIPSNRVCHTSETTSSSSGNIDDCMEPSLDIEYILAVANTVSTTYW